MKKLRVFETFAGIGAQHKALEILKKNIKSKFDYEIVGTCEWDIWANISYNSIHNDNKNIAEQLSDEVINNFLKKYTLSNDGKNPTNMNFIKKLSRKHKEMLYSSLKNSKNQGSIINISGKKLINKIGEIDLLTYSFPCQDLSNAGNFYGFNKGMKEGIGTRSSLIWEISRILNELKEINKLPKFLLLENVKNMISSKHKNEYLKWLNCLKKLGYNTKTYLLNSKDYSIPQARTRVFAYSVLENNKEKIQKKDLDLVINIDNIQDISKEFKIDQSMEKLLKLDYKIKKYYQEAIESSPNNTPSRRMMYKNNPKLWTKTKDKDIFAEYARTITTKQDRHPNAGIIDLKNTKILNELVKNGKSNYRFLTTRETFLLMGFEEKDFENVNEIIKRKDLLYRQARKLYCS